MITILTKVFLNTGVLYILNKFLMWCLATVKNKSIFTIAKSSTLLFDYQICFWRTLLLADAIRIRWRRITQYLLSSYKPRTGNKLLCLLLIFLYFKLLLLLVLVSKKREIKQKWKNSTWQLNWKFDSFSISWLGTTATFLPSPADRVIPFKRASL